MAVCATCGTTNVEGTKFCVSCGAALSQAPAPGSWRTPTEDLSSGGPAGYAPPPPAAAEVYAPPAGVFNTPLASGVPFAHMRYAEWIDRVLAALIDGALNVAVMIVLYIGIIILASIFGAIGGDVGEFLAGSTVCLGALLVFLSVLGLGLYNKVYLVSKRGFSIGQGLMKLKVVDAMGNIPSTGTLILRLLVQAGMAFIPFLSVFLILLDVLWPLWDEKKQTLHDKAAGTFVIKTG